MNEKEIWRAHPEYAGIEVSTWGRVRTLDRTVVSNGRGTYLVKGRVLKQAGTGNGYLGVSIKVDGKQTTKRVHRMIAQAFISNPDNLPEINHKDNNPLNNDVSNLEWCTHEYNMAYKEKYGKPAKESAPKSPVFAINLKTLEVSHFLSQTEAGRELGLNRIGIINVIKGRQKTANGYWFVNDDGHADDAIKHKLQEIKKTKLNFTCK